MIARSLLAGACVAAVASGTALAAAPTHAGNRLAAKQDAFGLLGGNFVKGASRILGVNLIGGA